MSSALAKAKMSLSEYLNRKRSARDNALTITNPTASPKNAVPVVAATTPVADNVAVAAVTPTNVATPKKSSFEHPTATPKQVTSQDLEDGEIDESAAPKQRASIKSTASSQLRETSGHVHSSRAGLVRNDLPKATGHPSPLLLEQSRPNRLPLQKPRRNVYMTWPNGKLRDEIEVRQLSVWEEKAWDHNYLGALLKYNDDVYYTGLGGNKISSLDTLKDKATAYKATGFNIVECTDKPLLIEKVAEHGARQATVAFDKKNKADNEAKILKKKKDAEDYERYKLRKKKAEEDRARDLAILEENRRDRVAKEAEKTKAAEREKKAELKRQDETRKKQISELNATAKATPARKQEQRKKEKKAPQKVAEEKKTVEAKRGRSTPSRILSSDGGSPRASLTLKVSTKASSAEAVEDTQMSGTDDEDEMSPVSSKPKTPKKRKLEDAKKDQTPDSKPEAREDTSEPPRKGARPSLTDIYERPKTRLRQRRSLRGNPSGEAPVELRAGVARAVTADSPAARKDEEWMDDEDFVVEDEREFKRKKPKLSMKTREAKKWIAGGR